MSRTYEQLEPVIRALDERIKTGLGAFPTDTAEGSIVSFPDGANDIPLKSLVVDINPVQSGSGDPSPDNVRPISGWTGANVTRCGKNFCELKPLAEWYTIRKYNIADLNLPKDTQVYMSVTDKDTSVDVSGYSLGFVDLNWDGTENLTQYRWVIYDDSTINQDCSNRPTSGKDIYLGGLIIYPDTNAAYNALFARYNIMIELSQSPTPYEPYAGQTIPINWQTEAGTVYGGSLDVLSGVLTVYPYYASYNGETLTGRWISDRDVYAVGTTPTIGAQVVNIGAQGTEIQLSPHEVKSLLGQNNIFADTGDTTAEYRADTKMYIKRLTAPDSADMIADSNIVSGQYFMVGNVLYKATANIASGGQVIEGTNAIRKSLSEALNEINS